MRRLHISVYILNIYAGYMISHILVDVCVCTQVTEVSINGAYNYKEQTSFHAHGKTHR